MNDARRFIELAENLRADRPDAASAIGELLKSLSAISDASESSRQESLRQTARIADLERQLQMVNGIRYQEMRLILPEGGSIILRWPDHMTAESADMLRDVFELQMKAHAQFMQKKGNLSRLNDAPASSTGDQGGVES
ncbi:hypothetical protein [Burkholderia sp. Ax-1724]|uniref:hypothetical protein n=1 Tax=Burkholderia sp. Ax-1724 TaxID=2608336 RepID=UPI00141F060F|nr:hypothetical protein [Burkholderia sp. Ax-1724]NIF51442.1 hypothetical protein [Burkholderia sp. Ax-1724]